MTDTPAKIQTPVTAGGASATTRADMAAIDRRAAIVSQAWARARATK